MTRRFVRHMAPMLFAWCSRSAALPVALLAALSVVLPAADGPGARVIAVRDGEAIEYDAATFAARRRVALPKEAAEHPAELTANAAGQLLFAPPGDSPLWFSDGTAVRFLPRGARHIPGGEQGGRLSVEAVPECRLSADGSGLYWFENEFRTARKPGAVDAIDESVATTFRMWRTDLAGGSRSPVVSIALPRCRCRTGACDETCPEISVWTPEEGLADFFILSRWIPGQLGATYASSSIYRRSNGRWAARELPSALETVLDAGQAGDVIVHAVNDGGCCGWVNEGDDRTLLARGGRTVRLFDEREEYKNDNYDVSFFTSNAKLSPDARYVGMTITSTLQPRTDIRLSIDPRQDIRLSIDGKADAAELERIRSADAELPAVVVVSIAAAVARRTLRIPHAAVIGWLDDDRLLVRHGEAYEVVDPRGGTPAHTALPEGGEVLVRSR